VGSGAKTSVSRQKGTNCYVETLSHSYIIGMPIGGGGEPSGGGEVKDSKMKFFSLRREKEKKRKQKKLHGRA